MEAYFAAEYGMDVAQVFRLKWRRFLVYFRRGFRLIDPNSSPEFVPAEETVSRSDPQYGGFDWNAALDKATGRETPRSVKRMSAEELVRMMR